ncbi:hypothetical protein E2C01_101064 [Portunus trituberculatus]|uniref:Uncharacterized protein n=1 Tax=Portunus trituberculatus TaxID=210409 RepID=A0A5B7KEN5_PORTR|nr:hypothetical protein [Portunus trituberculatus]
MLRWEPRHSCRWSGAASPPPPPSPAVCMPVSGCCLGAGDFNASRHHIQHTLRRYRLLLMPRRPSQSGGISNHGNTDLAVAAPMYEYERRHDDDNDAKTGRRAMLRYSRAFDVYFASLV